jgi:hypothetical protein
MELSIVMGKTPSELRMVDSIYILMDDNCWG